VIVLSVLGVLVLGTWGAEREYPSHSLFDSFYVALSLFALGGSFQPPVDPVLQAARILAPLITGYAVLRAVILLFRDNFELVRIAVLARAHVVVAGLGSTGSRLVRALDDADLCVVVIERDHANPGVAACRDRGISVLIGDARDPLLLGRSRLARADHMFIACGDDRIDMDVAAAATKLVAQAPRDRLAGEELTLFVALDDLRLWRALSARMLTSKLRPGVRLELFHVYEAAATELVDAHPPYSPEATHPHVMLVGIEGVGEALILRIGRRWLAERREVGARISVTIVGPHATDERDRLLARYPELERVCELHTCVNTLQDRDLGVGVQTAHAAAGPVSSVYVCLESESDALAAALSLGKLPALSGTTVVVTLQDSDAGMANALVETQRELDNVAPFGVLTAALTGGLLLSGVTELLARAKHEEYVHAEEVNGNTPAENPSMRPWNEIERSLKSENRAFVSGIGHKLDLVGCAVVPSPLADPTAGSFEFSDDQIELLATEEHERWMESRRRQGYRYGRARMDQGPDKRHPLFVDFADLPADEQEKDRSPVRQLPAMLARAGFEVVAVGAGRSTLRDRSEQQSAPVSPRAARAGSG
jgi:voltage-gated potassium channel Kch